MPSLVITGANRGVGLALTRSFARDGWTVHACCRHPERAEELNAIGGSVTVHRLDVSDALQISALARGLADQPVDILINNAGLRGSRGSFGQVDYDQWAEVMAVNAMAPLRMAEELAPLLAADGKGMIVNVSSRMGSVDDNRSGGDYIYRSSKTALNMVTRSLSIDLAGQGITVICVHPGWVATSMGGPSAPLPPEQAAANLRKLFDRIKPEDSGSFLDQDGSRIPW